jgi:outer membrane protein TolC
MAGVQLSQYFGLSTLNASGIQQETSPKIGQSTRTATKTASGSLGILDGFKQKSEAKDSAFLSEQARVQEERIEMEVANGVREAYANLKKAIAQMKIADNGAPLANAEYAIAKIKSAHREMPYSERAVTRNRLALAQAAINDARAYYQIACAALDRAVGVTDFL